MQDKYINQIFDLFQDFHILLVPQLTDEVRGAENIRNFSIHLTEEYNPEEHGEMLEVFCVGYKQLHKRRYILSTNVKTTIIKIIL